VSAETSDARTRCAKILFGLTTPERFALKAVSNAEPTAARFPLLAKFEALGLVEHDGERIVLTDDGLLGLRLDKYATAARTG